MRRANRLSPRRLLEITLQDDWRTASPLLTRASPDDEIAAVLADFTADDLHELAHGASLSDARLARAIAGHPLCDRGSAARSCTATAPLLTNRCLPPGGRKAVSTPMNRCCSRPSPLSRTGHGRAGLERGCSATTSAFAVPSTKAAGQRPASVALGEVAGARGHFAALRRTPASGPCYLRAWRGSAEFRNLARNAHRR